jgi:phosphatidylglycerol:prolipoprotein diacylglycerol transferase
MFPTIGHLINYLFHSHLVFPVQTLGFFMAMAFVLSYQVFKSEFKRKEAEGKIHAFTEKIVEGKPAPAIELFVNGLLGFLLGFKILGVIISWHLFAADPRKFILSGDGSWICGIICGFGFGYWAWYDRKKVQLPQPVVVEKVVHPYQLMLKLVFIVAFWGFIGAKLFDTAEHFDRLKYDPMGTLFSVNGFTYYGGLIFGALAYLYFCHKRGMRLDHLADIGSPGMMLAYAVGRIGCALSGDGDWGIVNTHPKPGWIPQWAWSFKFPHNVINVGIPINNCVGDFCHQLAQGVYPTSFYEAMLCLLLFGLMWAARKHIYAAGLMFYIYLILNGTERILIETIRVNIRYRFLGMDLTQAEWICTLMIIGGIAGILSIIYHHKKTKPAPVLKNN